GRLRDRPSADEDAGVVDEDVDPPEALEGSREQALDLLLRPYVDLDRERVGTDLAGDAFEVAARGGVVAEHRLLLGSVGENDPRAGLGEAARDVAAEPARRSGDDRDGVAEVVADAPHPRSRARAGPWSCRPRC